MQTWQSVALTVLELLATNAPKFFGSRDLGYAPFSKICNVLRLDCHWERAQRHNIRGVKLNPASRRRYKIGLPVEGLIFCHDSISCYALSVHYNFTYEKILNILWL